MKRPQYWGLKLCSRACFLVLVPPFPSCCVRTLSARIDADRPGQLEKGADLGRP
jgi:hypothetical protein